MKIDQEFILSKDISHLELSFPTFAFATILLCYEIPVLFYTSVYWRTVRKRTAHVLQTISILQPTLFQ